MPHFVHGTLALLLATGVAIAHEVEQMFVEFRAEGEQWTAEVLFDAAYALPELRADLEASPPRRSWLAGLPDTEHARIRRGAEEVLRANLGFHWNGKYQPWTLEFPDFHSDPPGFPTLRIDLAVVRAVLHGEMGAAPGKLQMTVNPNSPLNYVLSTKTGGGGQSFLTIPPGGSGLCWEIADDGSGHGGGGGFLWFGYRHVLPGGWDHVLFILALFFVRRDARAMLVQSLIFTVAHSFSLALVLWGTVPLSGRLVETIIALSITAMAVANLKSPKVGIGRLWVVFVFGLVHGLGFASVLRGTLVNSGWGGLVLANFGIEMAQITVLAAAWLLTCRWHQHRSSYELARRCVSVAIALIGLWWAAERCGLIV